MSIFKKFFKDNVHDRDPEKESVKEKEKPKYYGTVIPYPNFNASSDASVLQSAIESKGVDEDVIIAILVKRSNEQRQKIKAVYEASSGKNLVKSWESVLRSDLEDVALALLMPPAHFDAYLLRKATKRLGTDEEVLIEILATRTNSEIQEIKRVFKQEYKQDLEEVIKEETKGDFMNALLALLSAKRDESTEVDMELARKDAKILFEAAETKGDIDVSTFIDILTTRNGPQLSKTFHHYAAVSDLKLPRALQMELSGDIEDCLIAIVKCAWNTPAFFAEKLHNAMKGHGTCEDTLIRVLVSRSEIDLQKIVEEYRAMYENTVHEDIVNDTKGHYQKVLLGLCGPY
ncbi:annexin A1-like [Cyprinodon tularosa]|uniref:annexin A1-like n=1 Tax=Cyprinodon tularosa TaxID=77115 RepID=UPI0018E255BB|nr:annexin A1-like [Cyprinodon tularosa]XP_038143527.1 annexin A1-like [Cyprinodon tularosa]